MEVKKITAFVKASNTYEDFYCLQINPRFLDDKKVIQNTWAGDEKSVQKAKSIKFSTFNVF